MARFLHINNIVLPILTVDQLYMFEKRRAIYESRRSLCLSAQPECARGITTEVPYVPTKQPDTPTLSGELEREIENSID
jgi:hypothetical protein